MTEILQKVVQNCYNQTSSIEIDRFDNGLLSGGIGICLFNLIYEKQFNLNNDLSIRKLESLLNLSITEGNLCNGSSGILWVLVKLKENNIIEIDNCILDELKNHCYNRLIKDLKSENHDFLHGAFGILHVLLLTNYLKVQEINEINNLFRKITFNNGCFKTNINGDSNRNGLNLHLAHGISSYILILCEFYELKKDEFIYNSISNHVKILMSKIKYGEYSVFPTSSDNDSRAVRNAWCYGDMGIVLAINKSGCVLNNSDLKYESKKILKQVMKRKTYRSTLIKDFSVCHGLMGNILTFKTCLNNLKLEDSTVIDFYLDKILKYYEKFGGRSLMYREDNCYVENHSILSGYSGIGLTILSLLDRGVFNWAEILLLKE